jgi:hypothetical protein
MIKAFAMHQRLGDILWKDVPETPQRIFRNFLVVSAVIGAEAGCHSLFTQCGIRSRNTKNKCSIILALNKRVEMMKTIAQRKCTLERFCGGEGWRRDQSVGLGSIWSNVRLELWEKKRRMRIGTMYDFFGFHDSTGGVDIPQIRR